MTHNPSGAENPYGARQPAGGLGPMPGDNDTRRAVVAAPDDVQKSFMLWLVSIGIGVLGAIVGIVFADRDKAIDEAMKNGSDLTRDQASSLVNGILVGTAVTVLIILALELFFVFKMRAGKNWARIVLTVLGVLGILSALYGLTAGLTFGVVLNLISMLVVIAAIVFMFKPAASAYFSRSTELPLVGLVGQILCGKSAQNLPNLHVHGALTR